MTTPPELRQEAHRLETEAVRREEVAVQLRSEMAQALAAAEAVVGAIDDAVWRGGAAQAADAVIRSSQGQVRRAAEHVSETVSALRRETEELRADAARLRQQADGMEPQLHPPIRGR